MAKVEIASDLKKEIFKKFKSHSHKIFDLLYSLKENPKKGKTIGQVSGIVIKELKYEGLRFYFITDGYRLRVLSIEKLKDLVIRFIRMSDKNNQQKTINEIKQILNNLRGE